MTEELVPIFRVDDGHVAATWYERLGFEVRGEHCWTLTDPFGNRLRIGTVAADR